MFLCRICIVFNMFCLNKTVFSVKWEFGYRRDEIRIQGHLNHEAYGNVSTESVSLEFVAGDTITYTCERNNCGLKIDWRQEKGGVIIAGSKPVFVQTYTMKAVLDSFDNNSQWICRVTTFDDQVLRELRISLTEKLDKLKPTCCQQNQSVSEYCGTTKYDKKILINEKSKVIKGNLYRIKKESIEKIEYINDRENYPVICVVLNVSSEISRNSFGKLERYVTYMRKQSDLNFHRSHSLQYAEVIPAKIELKYVIIIMAAVAVIIFISAVTCVIISCLMRRRKRTSVEIDKDNRQTTNTSPNLIYAKIDHNNMKENSNSVLFENKTPYAKIVGVVVKKNTLNK